MGVRSHAVGRRRAPVLRAIGHAGELASRWCRSPSQGEVPVPAGLRLFLPDEWVSDADRCARAGVPEAAMTPASKGETALAGLDQVRAVPPRGHGAEPDVAGEADRRRDGPTNRGTSFRGRGAGNSIIERLSSPIHKQWQLMPRMAEWSRPSNYRKLELSISSKRLGQRPEIARSAP